MSNTRLAAVVGTVELGYRVTARPYVCALVTWTAALAGGGPGVFRVASWHLSLRNAETSLRQLFNRAGRRGYALCAGVVGVREAGRDRLDWNPRRGRLEVCRMETAKSSEPATPAGGTNP